jgi:hypothetical protein
VRGSARFSSRYGLLTPQKRALPAQIVARSEVELGGLEPPTPCLQSDVSIRVTGLDLHHRLAVSDRYVPLRTEANGTLMARRPNRPYVKVAGL